MLPIYPWLSAHEPARNGVLMGPVKGTEKGTSRRLRRAGIVIAIRHASRNIFSPRDMRPDCVG